MPHICHSGVKLFTLTSPKPRSYPFRAQWIIPKSHMSLCHNMDFQVELPWKNESPSSTSFSSCGRFGSALNSFTNAWKVKRQFTGQRDKNLMQIGPKTLRLYQNMMVWLWHINRIGVNSSVDWKLQSFFKWGLRNARGILTKHPSSWRLDTIRSQASTAYAYGALEFWGAANGRHG